ncbi:MAG: hypothetical protein ACU0A9_16965 [Alterinioella nitratireducens]|uniref:hypothetical protein n=1 Tax=Alterinioella nitratireducens TaxID=2735915 RepID=UPI0040595379
MKRRIIALIGLLMLALPLQLRAQTVERIPEYRAMLSDAEAALNEDFAMARARAELQDAFDSSGIGFSNRYLDRWSATVFQRWSRMRLFFDEADARLAEWQAALDAGEVSEAEAEAALAVPTAQLLEVARRIPEWLHDDVARLAERAFWTDLAQDVGCCDALYYLALDEADRVWASSASPDAATVAGLDLIPPVGDARHDAEAANFAALSERVETLDLEGGNTATLRRVLINDALLLADLFGTARFGDLADLAAREGFSARPVAPLLALARITEPGPLRTMLIERARLRLEARAAHLGLEGPDMNPVTDMASNNAPEPEPEPELDLPIADAPAGGVTLGIGSSGANSGLDAFLGGAQVGSGAVTQSGNRRTVAPSTSTATTSTATSSTAIIAAPTAAPPPAAAPLPDGQIAAVERALEALSDDSQAGLAAATEAAEMVDALLEPGDIRALQGQGAAPPPPVFAAPVTP